MVTTSPQINYPNSPDPNSFESGLAYQDFICDLLRDKLGIVITNYSSARFQFGTGENKQGIEIKLDRDSDKTRRLSIEVAEKTKANKTNWTPSGIYRNDNSWLYIQGTYNNIFIFAKSLLLGLHKSHKYKEHEETTIKAFFLPFDHAKKYAAFTITLNTDNEKLKKWVS